MPIGRGTVRYKRMSKGNSGMKLLTILTGAAAREVWFPVPQGFDQNQPDEILPLIRHEAEAAGTELPFQTVHVFGDSCCDTGNQFSQTNMAVPDPNIYWKGRFSNGPVWPDYLQAQYNVNLINYAHGGATINSTNFSHGAEVPDFERQFDAFKETKRPLTDSQLVLIDFVGNDLMGKHVGAAGAAADMERVMQRMVDESDIHDFLVMLSPIEDYHRRGFNHAVRGMVARFETKNSHQGVRARSLALMEYYSRLRTTPPPHVDSWRPGSCYNQLAGTMCPDPQNHFKFDLYHLSTLPNHATSNYIASEILAQWGSKSH